MIFKDFIHLKILLQIQVSMNGTDTLSAWLQEKRCIRAIPKEEIEIKIKTTNAGSDGLLTQLR